MRDASASHRYTRVVDFVAGAAFKEIPERVFGYIYDADGRRVAKGTIAKWSCDPSVNGFQTINDYVLGPSGEQVTEMGMDASGNLVWQHTNVFAGGALFATYDSDGLHFYLDDPLGTRRAQTDYAGVLEQTCSSLPFGDALACSPSSTYPSPNAGSLQYPTEHHFTGKERDTESGNDYFGARYYGSSMGRFMSPDWIDVQWGPVPVPGADFDNPQSLNLYSYVLNNSLTSTDPDGHDVQVCDANGQCNTISNDAYTAGQKGNNGGLNVPTLNQVGNNQTNGTFNATAITDANGNTVGTATYVARNPGIDPYVGNNMAGYQEIGAANKVVTYGAVGTAVVFGGVAAAAAAPEVAAAIGRQGIKFALEHGMRWEVGHTMVMATASEVKAAIGAAVASGLASGEIQQGIIKGQTMVNGTIIAFTGFMNSAGQITISNVMGGFNK